jgi:hypothetical protein
MHVRGSMEIRRSWIRLLGCIHGSNCDDTYYWRRRYKWSRTWRRNICWTNLRDGNQVTVTRDQLWRLSEITASALAITSFVILLGLHYYFLNHRSNFPDPILRTIYPLNEHGRIVYLTWQESMTLKVLFWETIVSFLFCVVVDVRINPFNRNYPFIRSGRE